MAAEVARYWRHAGVPGVDLLRARFVTHRYSRHAHETYTFALIEAGTEVFEYGGSLLRADTGAVALLNPEVVHTGQAETPAGWAYRVLYPAADVVAGVAADLVLIGSRNALYGLRMTGLLEARGGRKLLTAHGVIDETTAVSLAQPGAGPARLAFRATFATLYVTWNLSTLLGAYGAGRLGSPQSLGIDVVGPAAFLALIWPQVRAGRTERAVGLLGAAIALTATPFLPPGVPVILAATAALAGALATPARPASAEPAPAGPASAEPAPAGPA